MRVSEFAVEASPVQPEARRFQVKPSAMYPAALADLQDALETNRTVSTALETYKAQAAQLDPEAWGLALTVRGELTSRAALLARSGALELARLWFTESLHQFIDHGLLEIHILKDEDWRL